MNINKENAIFWILGIGIIGFILFRFNKAIKELQAQGVSPTITTVVEKAVSGSSSSGSSSGSSGSSSNSSSINKSKVLKRGNQGEDVKELQKALNKVIKPPLMVLVEDGIFGQATENAMIQVLGKKTGSISEVQAKNTPNNYMSW